MSVQDRGVPYSSIDRFEPGFEDRWLETVREITRKTQFIDGEWVKRCEKRLAEHAGVTEVRGCANGTDAIQIALRAVGVGSGDVVLVPDLTFWASFEAVCNVGARPVTLDVDRNDSQLSVALVEEGIKKFHPKAVILVHLYGWAARDTFAIRKLCRQMDVHLIEDSAQAWGVKIDGESVFAGAEISTTSFYPGKVLGGAGDGGAILTNDRALADRCHLLAHHGRMGKYEFSTVGWNSRFDNLQAAFVCLSLDHIESRIASRKKAVQWYRDHVRVPGIAFKGPAAGIEETGYISVAHVDPTQRARVMQRLDEAKIGYAVVYPGPMHLQVGAKDWIHGSVDYGNSDWLCRAVINLPCFAGISEEELSYVGRVVSEIFA